MSISILILSIKDEMEKHTKTKIQIDLWISSQQQ